ncbi:helix-turn-helix domain-containing protein [Paenibacillus daejeonensis]|uniref:helix-turn-helix domain-containing protein n=1 Tax=Paenibacillus daejeonensis TaxID=135193 RepID=UPI00035E4348|nr:helix-turn-helix domain-containing protein [Paenibacillus daejeonensis]
MFIMQNYYRQSYTPEPYRQQATSHLLGVTVRGSGRMSVAGHHYSISEGDGILIDHGEDYELQPRGGMDIIWICFDDLLEISQTDQERHYYKRSGTLPWYGPLPTSLMPIILDLVTRIEAAVQERPERRRNLAELLFQQLIYHLMELAEPDADTSQHALERAADYIRMNYDRTLTRNQIAEVAGLSPWYFSHLFKKWKGIAPMEYLHQVRINHAKELLILHRCSVREAAERSGYGDEAYFRKKFKQVVGITPAAYHKDKWARIASLSYTYTSHLLTLGMIPLAAMADPTREAHRSQVHAAIAVHLRRTMFREDELLEADIEQLRAIQPSLILGDDLMMQGTAGTRLAEIAPCEIIPWMAGDWRSHFLQIARLVEREAAAVAWLADYDRLVLQARRSLARRIGSDKVMLIRLTFGQLVVYGRRNVGTVLYEDLNLVCPYDLDDFAVEKPLSEAELALNAPDYLLLVIDHSPASQSAWERLQDSESWHSLPAVRQAQVYQVQEYPWLEYSPEAHRLMVAQASELLGCSTEPPDTAQIATESSHVQT